MIFSLLNQTSLPCLIKKVTKKNAQPNNFRKKRKFEAIFGIKSRIITNSHGPAKGVRIKCDAL